MVLLLIKKLKIYRIYIIGLILSVINAFILLIIRIIGIVIISKLNADDFYTYDEDDIETIKKVSYALFPFGIILDWILPGILLCYVKKVQYLCELVPNNQNIFPDNQTIQMNNINNNS